jgi:hypothetical protein
MTIRQQGGIFGRNPTFNNVTVDGTLTVDQIVEKTGAAGITLDGVTLKDGNVVLANGNGIDFSATAGTGTSELFDDYEEGTWTPVLSDGTSNATMTANTVGAYTKTGDFVFFTARIQASNATTLSGNLRCIGLPFTVGSSQSNRNGVSVGAAFDLSITAGTNVSASCEPTQSYFTLRKWDVAAGTSDLTDADVGDFCQFWVSGCYKV